MSGWVDEGRKSGRLDERDGSGWVDKTRDNG